MKITKQYTELVDDLIAMRIGDCDVTTELAKELLRYGYDGYINKEPQVLANEAISKKIYGSIVDDIEVIV